MVLAEEMISLTDRFALTRDPRTAKPKSFRTRDGRFAFNLATNPARMEYACSNPWQTGQRWARYRGQSSPARFRTSNEPDKTYGIQNPITMP